MKYRIIVCGSRYFDDYNYVASVLSQLLKHIKDDTVVVHGGARGADILAEQWCKNNNVPTEVHIADWHKYGRKAGPIRNKEMAEKGADYCIAFFKKGTVSKGTANMVKLAEENNITVMSFLA